DLASGSSPSPTPTPPPGGGGVPTPTPAPSGPASLTGFNPGTAGLKNSLTVTGAAKGATVSFYYSTATGTTSITSGACKGKTLSLSRATLIGSAKADSTGKATLNATLSRSLAGRTLYLQAKAETTACAITNRVTQKIKSSSGSSTNPPNPPPSSRPGRRR
ncbi:MAG TPA: hypothetical protein VHC46_06520, partial [Thermodesulfobacteriota bacterium]|nr:hypothetical protein [Thermodesulfobacteriota bacterium]